MKLELERKTVIQDALEKEIVEFESTVHDLQSEFCKKRPPNLEHKLWHKQRQIIDLDSKYDELAGVCHNVMEENEKKKQIIHKLRQEIIELREIENSVFFEQDRVIFCQIGGSSGYEEIRHQMKSKILKLQV